MGERYKIKLAGPHGRLIAVTRDDRELAGLDPDHNLKYSRAATVRLVIGFNPVMPRLLEAPLGSVKGIVGPVR